MRINRFIVLLIISIVIFVINIPVAVLKERLMTKEDVHIDEIINDLANHFQKNRSKYQKTIDIFKQFNNGDTLSTSSINTYRKKFGYWLYYKGKEINHRYPSFAKEMSQIWKDEGISAVFDRNNAKFLIRENNHCAYLMYTELARKEFINYFNGSMEYSVYPDLPHNMKNWICKLDTNWYLYDGYFPLGSE